MKSRYFPNLAPCIIREGACIRDAMTAISAGGALMACIVTDDRVLRGIVTDSDVRRGLLRGLTLDSPAGKCATFNPVAAPETASARELVELAHMEGVREIPLVDPKGRLCDIFVLGVYQDRSEYELKAGGPTKTFIDSPMLILAGGRGTRLRSMVSDRPKPLAEVAGKPLLQILIERARLHGIRKFYVSVNYMAEKIIEHLRDPQYQGLDIEIIREKNFLGTAGSMSLVEDRLQTPMYVVNGDVLTNIPFDLVLRHHKSTGAMLSCVVRKHTMTVPFGVVAIDHDRVTGIVEKPVQSCIVNAGIYMVSPEVMTFLTPGEPLDMPQLIQRVIAGGHKVSPFFAHEYWLDIGRPDDYLQANAEFSQHFN